MANKKRYLSFKGKTKSVDEWSSISGISKFTILMRIDSYGWSIEKALTKPLRRKVNLSESPQKRLLYRIWYSMHWRCASDKNYLDRGIRICSAWKTFENFYNWAMVSGYKWEPSGRNNIWTLDRRNNDGNYTPSNCRWVSYTVQNNNKVKTPILFYKGAKYTFSDILKKFDLKISRQGLQYRLSSGWSIEDIITKSMRPNERRL